MILGYDAMGNGNGGTGMTHSNERPEVERVEHEIDGILELPKK